MADRDFLAAVRERVVVFDGGMGATLEQFDLGPEDYGGLAGKCHEALVLNRPDVIAGVHASMVEAGAQVVETDTFQGSRLKLDEWGLGDETPEINRRAAEIAREAVGEGRFVAGSIGPTGFLPASDHPTLGDITLPRLVEVFAEQARGLVEGGAALIIIAPAQDLPTGPASPRSGLPFATEPDRLPGPPRAMGELPVGESQPPSTLPGRLSGPPRAIGEAPPGFPATITGSPCAQPPANTNAATTAAIFILVVAMCYS